MISIYALMSGQLVLYVGKTNNVVRRASGHRSKSNEAGSKNIPSYTEWGLTVLEETTDALGTEREQYWYDTLKPLYNYCRPGQTKKAYGRAYRQSEADKASRKAYRQSEAYKAHRQSEAYKAYARAYRQRKKLEASVISLRE